MAKKKVIIHYDGDMKLYDVFKKVLKVISMGRISKARGRKQFCFVTTFHDGLIVYAMEKRNDTTDTFAVERKK